MAQYQFNATQYEPRYNATNTMTPGKHIARIVESEFRPTKDSTPADPRSMLCLTIVADDGGSIVDRLNVQNPNQQTVQIAYSQLAAYCAVTGRQGFNDTSELHNIPFMVEVAPQKNNPTYVEVVGVYFADGRPANAGPALSPTQTAQAEAMRNVAPPFSHAAPAVAPHSAQVPVAATSPTTYPSSPQPAPFAPVKAAIAEPPPTGPAFPSNPQPSGMSAPFAGQPSAFVPGAAPPWARR